MTEKEIHCWMDLIMVIIGATIIGFNFGYQIGIATGCLAHALRQVR
jgi:hypothetical protein